MGLRLDQVAEYFKSLQLILLVLCFQEHLENLVKE